MEWKRNLYFQKIFYEGQQHLDHNQKDVLIKNMIACLIIGMI